jgi:hypothetical protein
MPFIPWKWGRVFFEKNAHLDFYEPSMFFPLFKSINFEVEDNKFEFKRNQKIVFEKPLWIIQGETKNGVSLNAKIRSYRNIKQTFETKRSRFVYNEMPSALESLSIKRGDDVLYSKETFGESVANCENAYYEKILLP